MEASMYLAEDKEGIRNEAHARKIPFELKATLVLRSLSSPAHRAKTRIVGVVDNEFLIIEEPVFSVNDRLSAAVGEFSCIYFYEGCIYKFKSRFRKNLANKLLSIDYPETFESKQLREHDRVKVLLDADVSLSGRKEPFRGCIRDISEGGSCLEFTSLIPFVKGSELKMSFKLPDNQLVEGIQCKIMNTLYSYAWRKTQVGLSFSGPDSELRKIKSFCSMCKYFRV